jgi:hypothetical protein
VSTVIRLANISDADHIASLVQRYWEFETIPGFDRPRITTLLAAFLRQKERGACWLAMKVDKPIGYLLAVYVFSLEHGGMMAEIDELRGPRPAIQWSGNRAIARSRARNDTGRPYSHATTIESPESKRKTFL